LGDAETDTPATGMILPHGKWCKSTHGGAREGTTMTSQVGC